MGIAIKATLCYNKTTIDRKGRTGHMKRILTAVFVAVLLICVATATVFAQEEQSTGVLGISDEAIRILKLEEGFSTYPYWDYAQWTVGYGTKCPDDKLEEYRKNGISEEDAEALLRSFIGRFESELNSFMIRTGRQLNQREFDALMLFSYNCGTGWAYDTNGGLYNAIVGGATGSKLVNAFARWCNAGGQIKTFLLRRRLCEANIYLNGEYSQLPPEQFGYVLYDGNGGKASPNVQGYDTVETAQILSVAKWEGKTFRGWYTAITGGTEVTVLDAAVRNMRLYARWDAQQEAAPEEKPEEKPVEGISVTVSASSLNVRSGPGTNYPVVGGVKNGERLLITETAEGSGEKWGKCETGWICLRYTDYDVQVQPEAPEEPEVPEAPATKSGTVRVNDTLRVRSGPSTGYSVVGYLKNGDRVEILEEKLVGAMIWGKIASGWISMDYVEMDPEQTDPEPEPEPKPTEPAPTEPKPTEPTQPEAPSVPEDTSRAGTVKVSDVLRIRSGPGTGYSVVGYLKNGDRVTVTEQSDSGTMVWGKIEGGWVSLDYLVLDPVENEPEESVSGTVKVSDVLRVRTGPGTSYTICAYLSNGAKVTITEQRTVAGVRWGKMDKGWICLDYVELQNGQRPQTETRTVTADCLRVRSAAGTGNSIVGYLYSGAKVEILETKTADGTKWGRISQGWISMDYVK